MYIVQYKLIIDRPTKHALPLSGKWGDLVVYRKFVQPVNFCFVKNLKKIIEFKFVYKVKQTKTKNIYTPLP